MGDKRRGKPKPVELPDPAKAIEALDQVATQEGKLLELMETGLDGIVQAFKTVKSITEKKTAFVRTVIEAERELRCPHCGRRVLE